jgi:FkbM family methyltransferase
MRSLTTKPLERTSGPRRILHVGLALQPGGIEALVLGCYRRIDREKVQFDFAVREGPPTVFANEVLELGGRLLTFSQRGGPAPLAQTVRALLREHGPFAGLHGHVYRFNGLVLREAAAAGVPVRIAHSHFTDDGRGDSPLRWAYRAYTRRLIDRYATHKVGCSSVACETLFGADCWSDPRTIVIPNGIDLERFASEAGDREALRRELDIPPTALVVGHVGRFAPQKNHRQLVRVFERLLVDRSDAMLVLVGDGELKNEIAAMVERLGLRARVRFLGLRMDIPRVLSAFDVLVMPSLFEGFPLTLVEAHAAALPCVVSNTITPEVNLDSSLIRFVPLDAGLEEWSAAIQAAAASPRPDRASSHARLRRAGYDIADVAQTLTDVYLDGGVRSATATTAAAVRDADRPAPVATRRQDVSDAELRVLRAIGHRLPPLPRITGVVNRVLKPWYLRKPRGDVIADVLGFTMKLDPAEAVDGAYLFYPQLYDRQEIAFLKDHLGPSDVFIDVGAHIGFYSLIAAKAVGREGTVVAIEPEALSFERLVWNIEANNLVGVKPVNTGVSGSKERRRLGVNLHGNRGGSSFAHMSERGQEVLCVPLLDVLRNAGVSHVTGMKLDIEGDEFRVLSRYLREADPQMLPGFVIVEFHQNGRAENPLELLGRYDYRVRSRHVGNDINWILTRDS